MTDIPVNHELGEHISDISESNLYELVLCRPTFLGIQYIPKVT